MILDHYGREIEVPEEREVSGLLDVFGRWQDVGGRWAGHLLEYQDKILLEEGGTNYLAYEIYERVLSDDQVIACLQQRFGTQQEYEVIPGDDSRRAKKAAALFEENLQKLRWDLITYQMKFGFFFGKAVAEILWETEGDTVWIKDILVRDRRRFRFAKDKSLRLLTSTDTHNGINVSELYPAQFWLFSYGATHSDMPDGLGLAHYLYWPVTFKRQGVRFWLYALEKYGTNIPVAYYPAGITDTERDNLAKALVKLKHNSAISIPDGTKLEFLSGSSGIDNYEKLVQWADEAIAKVILTNTMTVESGSSRAQAQVHEHKANSITDSDNDLLCESFNRTVLRWWTWFNFENDTPPPQLWRVHLGQDTVRLAQRDKILYDMGFPPQPEYIKETYGDGFVTDEMLSGAGGEETTSSGLNGGQVAALTTLLTAGGRGDLPPDTLKAALIASFPSINNELAEQMVAPLRQALDEKVEVNKPPDLSALLNVGAAPTPGDESEPVQEPEPAPGESPPEMSLPAFKQPTTIELMAEQLERQATPEFVKLFTVLERALKESTTPEDFLLRVEALYPQIEDDTLIDIFQNGIYAAYLAGLSEVQDEGRTKSTGNGGIPVFERKKKNCVKGYSCGWSCISRKYKCHKQADGSKKDFVDAIGETEMSVESEKTLDRTLGIPDIHPVAQRGIDFLGVEFATRLDEAMKQPAILIELEEQLRQAREMEEKARNTPGFGDKSLAEYMQITDDLSMRLETAKAEYKKNRLAIMQEARDKLKTDVKPPTTLKLSQEVKDLNRSMQIQDALNDFYSITGGYGSSVKSLIKDGNRAYYRHSKKQVNVGSGWSATRYRKNIFHEIGHAVEYERLADLGYFGDEFLKKRATGKPKRLKELMGDPRYDDKEVAVPDHFVHPYAGKIYKDRMTELISIGLEHFASVPDMVSLYMADKEHFYLTIGAIR